MALLKRLRKLRELYQKPKHSPAGYRYLQEQKQTKRLRRKTKKKKKVESAGFSGRTKRELSYYSETERKEILKALRGK